MICCCSTTHASAEFLNPGGRVAIHCALAIFAFDQRSIPPFVAPFGSAQDRLRMGHPAEIPRSENPDLGHPAGSYLYVPSPRSSSSRWPLESVMEPNAGPDSGWAFRVSKIAA